MDKSIEQNSSGMVMIDPRLKLVLSIVAIATIFAAGSWFLLLVVGALAVCLLAQLGALELFRQRLYWLRWFFLFIVLVHLLLSPGYTLLGISWLSRDGLVHGALVSMQIASALAISLILTRSTSAEQLAAASASLLKPLSLLGINVQGFAEQILMTLRFVPLLQEEGRAAAEMIDGSNGKNRLQRLQMVFTDLMHRLVQRADSVAIEQAQGVDSAPKVERLSALFPLALTEWLAIGLVIAIALLGYGFS